MKKELKVLLIILILIVILGVGFFVWKSTQNTPDNSSINSIENPTNTKVNDSSLEPYVKQAIIDIAKKEINGYSETDKGAYSEGHKILSSEIKNNQLYVYVVAEYGFYTLENEEISVVSASSSPITIIFNIEENNTYKMETYLLPSNDGDEEWLNSLQEMFPANLINEVKNTNYKDSFYQNQIKSYLLNSNNESTAVSSSSKRELLLNVMNSKQQFITEDNTKVFFKDFKIVENQTAKVDKYAFVDLDKDGVDELVIYTTSDYGAYVILHIEDNNVYGYKINVRALENLKVDGSFMGSNSANSSEYLRISFNKNSYTLTTEAVYDGTNQIYKIDNSTVSKAEIDKYVENWDKKENVSWNK